MCHPRRVTLGIQQILVFVQTYFRPSDRPREVSIAAHTPSDSRYRLRGIEGQLGSGFLPAIKQRFEQVLHGVQRIIIEQGSHALPQPALAAHLGPYRLEQRTAQLLDLIHEKGQHHQHGKHHREVLVAMTKMVLEVVPLVFQRVERLIFNPPAGPTTPHDLVHRAFGHPQVAHPTEMLHLVAVPLPVLQKVHPNVGIGLIERQVTGEAKAMAQPALGILAIIIAYLARFLSRRDLREQIPMVEVGPSTQPSFTPRM